MIRKFKTLLYLSAFLGMTGVILGAFGAHLLSSQLGPVSMNAFNTGVDYHLFHALALLATAVIYYNTRVRGFYYIGLLFFLGILLFSGSLYILSMKQLFNIGEPGLLGLVTPFGGLILIGAWVSIFGTAMKLKALD